MAVAVKKCDAGGKTHPGGTETILIVEDEPLLREMARSILENHGYRILEARPEGCPRRWIGTPDGLICC